MQSAANYVTLSRLLLAPLLVFAEPLHPMFFILLLICAFTDVLDGYIARKTEHSSKLGDNLDSIADFVMYLALILALIPVLHLAAPFVIWIVTIGIIRILSMVIVWVKYRTFEMLHTYGNKVSGLIIILYFLSLIFMQSETMLYIACAAATLSALEELFIHIASDELHIDRKSIFVRPKQISDRRFD